jgi:hypothetical protein
MGLRYAIAEPIMVSSKMGPGIDVLRRDILHAVHANHLLPKPEVKLITKETISKSVGRAVKPDDKSSPVIKTRSRSFIKGTK